MYVCGTFRLSPPEELSHVRHHLKFPKLQINSSYSMMAQRERRLVLAYWTRLGVFHMRGKERRPHGT